MNKSVVLLCHVSRNIRSIDQTGGWEWNWMQRSRKDDKKREKGKEEVERDRCWNVRVHGVKKRKRAAAGEVGRERKAKGEKEKEPGHPTNPQRSGGGSIDRSGMPATACLERSLLLCLLFCTLSVSPSFPLPISIPL